MCVCVCVWQSVCTSPHYAVNLKARPTHTTFAPMTSLSTKSKSKYKCVCVWSCPSSGNVSSVSPASTQTLVLWTSPCCLGTAANSTRSSRWGSATAAALQLRLPSHQTWCPVRFHCDGLTTFRLLWLSCLVITVRVTLRLPVRCHSNLTPMQHSKVLHKLHDNDCNPTLC